MRWSILEQKILELRNESMSLRVKYARCRKIKIKPEFKNINLTIYFYHINIAKIYSTGRYDTPSIKILIIIRVRIKYQRLVISLKTDIDKIETIPLPYTA